MISCAQDKNPSKTAAAEFNRIATAYEVLNLTMIIMFSACTCCTKEYVLISTAFMAVKCSLTQLFSRIGVPCLITQV
jgi:hypothetical protein